ncbi:MAG: tRNA pseudouridine(55) synthase TruB [Campylobacterales bacterium]|nr:tRNA pseudouridine(55) synthase TruB [Campylobacterales bacterium]MBE0499583.1 tRNA pseudouridine(55) synthase TruB [Campylobacterales bacterium]
MNRIFVAYKPTGLSSNQFLSRLKRKYNVKKAGYSGTLDPFAKGCLIVAFGSFTRFFRFLDKSPKSYRATLWLGAASDTLDIEHVTDPQIIAPFKQEQILSAIAGLEGELEYYPPIYSAKKVDGKRAYDLARAGEEVILNTINSTIFEIRLIHYCHPFVTFEATVSEGTYIRSLAKMIAEKLGVEGSLSALERLREGSFCYNNEMPISPLDALALQRIAFSGDLNDIWLGKKIALDQLSIQKEGVYLLHDEHFAAVLQIQDESVTYLLNKVPLC